MIRSVIFDLGGTLVDFVRGVSDWRGMEALGTAALCRFLAQRGHRLPQEEFEKAMWDAMERGWQDAMAGRANARLPDLIAATVARFGIALEGETPMQAAGVYAEGVGDQAVPLEGVHEMLGQLKARGLRLGLLSNTTWPGQLHRRGMQNLGLLEFFDETVFSSDVGLWKPNAPAFHYVTERLGVLPSEAVFVGDQLQADVVGAQRAGLRAVWITADGAEPGDARPDAVIHRLAELPATLNRLG